MSDFMSRELWDDICKWHWRYLDTEESILKLETRKKIEDCIKEYLCIAQHNQKFFLAETQEVLKRSIRDMEYFSAKNAINAFDAISQYANNIFTKPWRKEFRILKMYSGYFKHEITSNLLDADKLFEAMGYRRLSEHTLILDGPICPDQVSNVSRDAMTAYVELQIIKNIYTLLDTNGIKCSWWDIFRYREKNTGGISQAIKALTKAAEDKCYRSRDKGLANDNYGYIDVQPSSNYLTANYNFCPIQCHCHLYQQHVPPATRQNIMNQTNGMLCLPEHHQSNSRTDNLMYNNISYPPQHNYQHYQYNQAGIGLPVENVVAPLLQMSHSRSLEHYSEPSSHHHNTLPHRHSFDHQQQGCTAQHQHQRYSQHQQLHNYQYINQPQQHFYESPYDCIESNGSIGGGSSSLSYAAVAQNASSSTGNTNCNVGSNSTYSHPYNVSGNRFPLPLNISNQISAYESLQSSNFNGSKEPTYAPIGDQYMYSSIPRQSQNCAVNTGIHNQTRGISSSSLATDTFSRQRSPQPEQLISFDDNTQQQIDSFNHYQSSYEPANNLMEKRYIQPLPTAACQHFIATKTATNDDMHVYAKPTPKENRKPLQNSIYLRKPSCTSVERGGDTTDISYESANDDLMNLPRQQSEQNRLHSPTQFTKNQDGVGSFESWSYVFQNLERSGYSKDHGDRRENLLVQSLDLDSLNINNDISPSQTSSVEKRKSNYAANENKNVPQLQQQQMPLHAESKQKGQTFKNSQYSNKNNTKMEILASSSSSALDVQKQRPLIDNNEKKMKSALKQTNATSKSNPNFNKAQPKNSDNKSHTKTLNNNNNDSSSTTNTNVENGITTRKKSSQNSVASNSASSKKSAHGAAQMSTQIIVTGSNEWSCTFCTYINPNTVRICEMCCRTKDNKLDAPPNSTVTGTNNVAHNTTTCA